MACILDNGHTKLELYVRDWSTSLSSGKSMQQAQGHNWASAWHPSNDMMSMTIRQGNQQAQRAAWAFLYQCMKSNSKVSLQWPERNLSCNVIVMQCNYSEDYNIVVKDITVQFLMLTNAIATQQVSMSVSTNVLGMLGEQVTKDLDDLQEEARKQAAQAKLEAEVANAIQTKKQWPGYSCVYNDDNTVSVTVKPSAHFGHMFGPTTYKTYRVVMSAKFVEAMQSGDAATIEGFLQSQNGGKGPYARN